MNGNFKSLADIKGKELYPGQAGTETNPYGIEDVFDFCAIKNDADKETTYYQLVNNIDFNDHPTYKNGITITSVINANRSILDGNGKSIRNIVYYTSAGSTNNVFVLKKIHNCNFENLVNACGNPSTVLFSSEFIERCSFYILNQNGYFYSLFLTSFIDCTLNIAGVMIGSFDLNRINLTRCYINFDNATSGAFNSGSSSYIIGNALILDHVYFTGKLNITSNQQPGLNLAKSGTFKNVYYSVDTSWTYGSGYTPYFQLYSAIATSFCNKDLLNQGLVQVNAASNFRALTDEQCRDPAYLASIGFPVIGV